MNLKEMTDALLLWVSQWVGVTLPLVVTLVAGLMLCVAAATALWTRRIRVAPATIPATSNGSMGWKASIIMARAPYRSTQPAIFS